MRNIKPELEDWMRPEYKRSDLGKIVRGKYAAQIQFAELIALLLSCVGDDEGIRFTHHSTANSLADHKVGEWTYEIDKGNQITLRYWLSTFGNISKVLSNPPCVMSTEDHEKLLSALVAGIRELKTKVASLP